MCRYTFPDHLKEERRETLEKKTISLVIYTQSMQVRTNSDLTQERGREQ